MTASGNGRAKCSSRSTPPGERFGLGDEPVERLVGQRLQARAERLDALPLERLIDQPAQAAVVRRVAEQHVGRQRLHAPRQPSDEGAHPAVPGRDRAVHEAVVVTQQVVHRVVGRRHPGVAEQGEPHADHRPQLAHPRQGRERVVLEPLRGQVKLGGGRLLGPAHRGSSARPPSRSSAHCTSGPPPFEPAWMLTRPPRSTLGPEPVGRVQRMTEREWANCSGWGGMLDFLRDRGDHRRKAGQRRFRLFACAALRRAWHLLTDRRGRFWVNYAELMADGATKLPRPPSVPTKQLLIIPGNPESYADNASSGARLAEHARRRERGGPRRVRPLLGGDHRRPRVGGPRPGRCAAPRDLRQPVPAGGGGPDLAGLEPRRRPLVGPGRLR